MAKMFRFLDLAAELRNAIYEYATIDDEPFLIKSCAHPPVKGRYLKSQCRLILANNQLSNEYYAVLHQIAHGPGTKIVAEIRDLDFNSLTDSVTNIMTVEAASKILARQKFVAQLTFTDFDRLSKTGIIRWLTFLSARGKKVGYECGPDQEMLDIHKLSKFLSFMDAHAIGVDSQYEAAKIVATILDRTDLYR